MFGIIYLSWNTGHLCQILVLTFGVGPTDKVCKVTEVNVLWFMARLVKFITNPDPMYISRYIYNGAYSHNFQFQDSLFSACGLSVADLLAITSYYWWK